MKKRIVSIVLTLTMIFGIFSCNAFANDEKNMASFLSEFPEELKMTVMYYNEEWDTEQKMTFYKKGDKIALDVSVPANDFGLNFKIRLVIIDDKAYVVFPYFPFIYASMGDVESVIDFENTDTDIETEIISREEEVIDGKTVVTQIIMSEDGAKSEVITEDGKLIQMKNYDENGNYMGVTLFEEISYKVSNLVFFVPIFGIDVNSIDFNSWF